MDTELLICGSGKGGWAWSARRGEQALGSGSGGAPGGAYRMGVCALLDALQHLSGGGPLRVQHRNATLADVLEQHMARWQDLDWPKDKKEVDLIQQLPERLAGWELRCEHVERTLPRYREAKLAAQAAAVGATTTERAERAAADVPAPGSQGDDVVIWTDGGCRKNPGGVGGWGSVMVHWASGATLERWGGARDTTNNRMEMTAAIEALRSLTRPGVRLELRTDSTYLIQVCTVWGPAWKRRGWTKGGDEPIKNLDLVQELDRLLAPHRVRWTWVKGHAGEPGNERVDALANRAMDALQAEQAADGEERHPTPPVELGWRAR